MRRGNNRIQSRMQRSSVEPYNRVQNPNTRLYVGNLSWEVTWQDLKDLFKQIGRVIRADVGQDETGKSKGYGLVEYENASDAEAAIAELNGKELKGRAISIREDRENNTSAPNIPNIAQANVGRKIYVGNLAYEVSWQDLKVRISILMLRNVYFIL